jgi:biopolymer transport protein ExbD
MAKAVPLRDSNAPMAAINITPLIDVMLVLLIMLIITIPMATHEVPVDLPQGKSLANDLPPPHELALAGDGRLFWDGRPIADGELPALLAGIRAERPDMALHMRTDGETPYGRFETVLATVKRAGIARLGFVGDHRFVE